MNPLYQFNRYVAQVQPPVLPPIRQLTLQDILNANNGITTNGAPVTALDPLAQIQQTLIDNLPNLIIGAVGLFMILVGIGAVATPVAKGLV